MAGNNPRINEVPLLSAAFIRWGLGLFIFGLIIGYSPLVHHLHGVLEKMGETTLQNAALWLASLPPPRVKPSPNLGNNRAAIKAPAIPIRMFQSSPKPSSFNQNLHR